MRLHLPASLLMQHTRPSSSQLKQPKLLAMQAAGGAEGQQGAVQAQHEGRHGALPLHLKLKPIPCLRKHSTQTARSCTTYELAVQGWGAAENKQEAGQAKNGGRPGVPTFPARLDLKCTVHCIMQMHGAQVLTPELAVQGRRDAEEQQGPGQAQHRGRHGALPLHPPARRGCCHGQGLVRGRRQVGLLQGCLIHAASRMCALPLHALACNRQGLVRSRRQVSSALARIFKM